MGHVWSGLMLLLKVYLTVIDVTGQVYPMQGDFVVGFVCSNRNSLILKVHDLTILSCLNCYSIVYHSNLKRLGAMTNRLLKSFTVLTSPIESRFKIGTHFSPTEKQNRVRAFAGGPCGLRRTEGSGALL